MRKAFAPPCRTSKPLTGGANVALAVPDGFVTSEPVVQDSARLLLENPPTDSEPNKVFGQRRKPLQITKLNTTALTFQKSSKAGHENDGRSVYYNVMYTKRAPHKV
jgi:hypothetical protein